MPTILLLVLTLAAQPADFLADFTGRTLRLDYHHAGDAREERVAPAGLRLEGEWPGSRTRLLDDTGLGKYLFEVLDEGTGRPLWSRGCASIFGEWETTAEARGGWRAFEECQRFPEPRRPVRLVLRKRQADGGFRELWAQSVDPAARGVDRAPLRADGRLTVLQEQGRPATQLDLLVLAEGYAADEGLAFEADARRLSAVLLETEPFRSRRARISVRALHLPAPQSGLSDPRRGQWRASALGCSFNAFDSDRYVLTLREFALREAAAQAPYDALILLCNARKYGGGGIFNLWATCTADSSESAYVFVHEFGHSFGGLADEYYSSQVAYEDFTPAGSEPWEPNVTALLDPARLKWADLVEPGTPLPTPWGKAEYDARDLELQARRAEIAATGDDAAAEAHMRLVRDVTSALLAAEPRAGRVGAFEGAAYEARGLYRPEVDCIMFTRNPRAFCRVCERALDRVLDLYQH